MTAENTPRAVSMRVALILVYPAPQTRQGQSWMNSHSTRPGGPRLLRLLLFLDKLRQSGDFWKPLREGGMGLSLYFHFAEERAQVWFP